MPAPVPAASYAVRGIICPLIVVSPVVFRYGDCGAELVVEADLGGHFFGYIYAVLLVPEQIYCRTLCLFCQGFCLCAACLLFSFGSERRTVGIYSVLELLVGACRSQL